jgi:hypothetical protein
VGHTETLTFFQNSDDCTGGCGFSANNTVKVQDTGANTVTVTVQLDTSTNPDWVFLEPAGAGHEATFAFDLTGFNSLTSFTTTTSGFTPISTTSGSLHMNGAGDFDYGLVFDNGGAGNTDGSLLTFVLSAAGLSSSSFVGMSFAADVFSGLTGLTGIIDFGASTPPVPLPPAALLFGTALLGMGILRRRRKKGVAQAF